MAKPKLKAKMTAREMLLYLTKVEGWYEVPSGNRSHRQLEHPTKPGKVTIPWHGNGNEILPPKTQKTILRQAGLL